MSLPKIIYLASLCDSISSLTTGIAILSCIVMAAIGFSFLYAYIEEEKHLIEFLKKLIKLSLTIFFISSFLSCIFPNERTVYMMIGAEGAKELYSSDTGQKILKIINNKIDEELSKTEKQKRRNER